jgi:hypothetical protein
MKWLGLLRLDDGLLDKVIHIISGMLKVKVLLRPTLREVWEVLAKVDV